MAVEDFRKPSGSPVTIAPASPFPSAATGLGDAIMPAKPTAAVIDTDSSARRFRLRIVAKPRVLLKVSAACVIHVPADGVASLADDGAHYLCPHYDLRPRGTAAKAGRKSATPTMSADASKSFAMTSLCPDGDSCPYVHADIANAQFLTPHSTTTAALRGPVPTYAPGALVPIRLTDAPDTAPAAFMCPSGRLMRNKAIACDDQGRLDRSVIASAEPIPLCLQLALRQRCDRGARCSFAHIVPSSCCDDDDDAAGLPPAADAVAGHNEREGRVPVLVRRGSGAPQRSLSSVSHAASAGALSTVATSGPLGYSVGGSGTPASAVGTPLSLSGASLSPRRRRSSGGGMSPYGADPRL